MFAIIKTYDYEQDFCFYHKASDILLKQHFLKEFKAIHNKLWWIWATVKQQLTNWRQFSMVYTLIDNKMTP